jgi:hypothetical protein
MKWTLLLLLPLLARAADPGIAGPITGFLYDGDGRMIRAIEGIPGAARLGPGLPLPMEISKAALSPRGDFGLVVSSDGSVYLVDSMRTGQPRTTIVSNALPDPGLIQFNETGTAAVLASASGTQIQIVSGLPDSPSALLPLDVSALGGLVTALAVDAAGEVMLAGIAQDGQGGIYRIKVHEGGPEWIAPVGLPTAIVFIHAGQDAVYADAAAGKLFLISGLSTTTNVVTLAAGADGMIRPSAVQRLNDDSFLVADTDAGTLQVIEISPVLTLTAVAAAWKVTRCEQLGDGTAIALNQPGSAPALMVDPRQPGKVLFVPVP